MRVISGSARGHGLKAPKHMNLRPTPARVKQAIFSSFSGAFPHAKILELFAGTGAFSIEALSQGAQSAVIVEQNRGAVSLILKNLKITHLEPKARVLPWDVRQALERLSVANEQFDVIFADPPYQKTAHHPPRTLPREKGTKSKHAMSNDFSWLVYLLHSPLLAKLAAPKGVIMIEYFKKETPPESPYLKFERDFCFGDTVVGVFSVILK